ncbi:MAG: acyl carrier protein [Cyanobacteria bacterium J06634_6]
MRVKDRVLTDRAITNKTTATEPDAIREWIVSYISDLLEVSADEIDTEISFDRYGLDSSAAIGLTGDLEDWLGKEVDPTLLYDYPTVEGLVEYLAD